MTISIEIPGASFTKYFDRAKLPYLSQAVGYYLLGADAASTTKNLVPGSEYPTASVVGSPAYGAGYAEVTGTTSRINGGFTSTTSAFTHIAVATAPWASGDRGSYCGYGVLINAEYMHSAIAMEQAKQYFNYSNSGAVVSPSIDYTQGNSFALVAMTNDLSTIKGYVRTGSAMLNTSAAAAGTPRAGEQFKIGLNYGYGTPVKIAAVATFNVALTQSQIEEVYAYLKPLLAKRGVAVL